MIVDITPDMIQRVRERLGFVDSERNRTWIRKTLEAGFGLLPEPPKAADGDDILFRELALKYAVKLGNLNVIHRFENYLRTGSLSKNIVLREEISDTGAATDSDNEEQ